MPESVTSQGLINPTEEDFGTKMRAYLRQPFTFTDFVRPCLAEFVGVALFVFIGTMSVSIAAVAQSHSTLSVAIAHGMTIMVLVAAFGHISGAHINPAVTLGVLLGGGIGPILALCYWIFQFSGSLVGAGLCRAVLWFTVPGTLGKLPGTTKTVYETMNGGAGVLAPGVTSWQGFLCEALLTSILVFTVLMTAVDTKGRTIIAPLSIGFALVVGILAGAHVSGGILNPARAFGPAVLVSTFNSAVWDNHWVYWVGPVAGALLASFLFRLFFAETDRRLIRKRD